VYIHSGEAGTPKMDNKYLFLDQMSARLEEMSDAYPLAVVMGDFNIAHTNNDLKNWKGNLKTAGFLPEERAYLDRWFGSGWVDVHRALVGDMPGPYTWWSQRGKAFDTDTGWRLDYQMATPDVAARATTAKVDRAASWDTRWSDHAPLVIDYDL
jgi:exodeoxyribonuclease-3